MLLHRPLDGKYVLRNRHADHYIAAFILYRQRYQAEILDQHPGLPNPEISKRAGELWKSEPESVKNEWKLLAEVGIYMALPRRACTYCGI